MTRARKAQRIAETYSQEKVDELVAAMAWVIIKMTSDVNNGHQTIHATSSPA